MMIRTSTGLPGSLLLNELVVAEYGSAHSAAPTPPPKSTVSAAPFRAPAAPLITELPGRTLPFRGADLPPAGSKSRSSSYPRGPIPLVTEPPLQPGDATPDLPRLASFRATVASIRRCTQG